MEDTFRVRVDRTFGSLSSFSSSSKPISSSLWSLTDEEIEKRSWNRESEYPVDDDEDEEDPFPTDVDRLLMVANGKLGVNDESPNPNPNANSRDSSGELEDDLQKLDDGSSEGSGGDASTSSQSCEAVDGEEELDVKSSIGMDCTLDFEEEEDERDKVAVGRETTCDRLYVSDVTGYTPHMESYYNEIPNSFKEASRDPRANHLAAKLRLKEDAEAATSFNSLHVSEQSVATASDAEIDKDVEAATSFNSLHVSELNGTAVSSAQNNKEDMEPSRFNSLHVSEQTMALVSDYWNKTTEDGKHLKSILKRKEDQMSDSKSEKRVRFEPNCKNNGERDSEQDINIASETCNGEVSSQLQDSSIVPDYVRNPSRYTHYTFDSLNDMSEESNRQAYMDFLNMVRKSKESEPNEVPADLSKPVIFNPKKRATNNEALQSKDIDMEEHMPMKSLPVSFSSQNRPEDYACEMEVDDEQETIAMKVGNGKRVARQYRLKQTVVSDEPDS